MVMSSLPLAGVSCFSLSKIQFDSKKRILGNLGYDVDSFKYSTENNDNLQSLYKTAKVLSCPAEALLESDEVDAWLCGEDNKCTDGKDDGKISVVSKLWNFGEGIVKTAVGAIRSLSSDKKKMAKFIGTAAVMAGLVAFGGPIGAGIVAVVGLLGAGGLIVNGIKDFVQATKIANEATTDAEAKSAYEQMGSGTFQVGVGVYCGRQAAGALRGIGGKCIQPPSFEETFEENIADISVLADKS